jgi:hypothetical protein
MNEETEILKTTLFKKELSNYILLQLEKYIKEGEHMDGLSFWNNFQTEKEAFEDFLRHYHFSLKK